MKVKVTPSKVHGNVKIPASKSMAHRALICVSLSDGTSIVSNVTNSKDIEATVGCMKALGANIKQIDETTYEVTGTNLFKQEGNITCNANESGSTLRFLIPLAACTNAKVKFLGQGRLLQRPMDVYEMNLKNKTLNLINRIKKSLYMEIYKQKTMLYKEIFPANLLQDSCLSFHY